MCMCVLFQLEKYFKKLSDPNFKVSELGISHI